MKDVFVIDELTVNSYFPLVLYRNVVNQFISCLAGEELLIILLRWIKFHH